MADSGIMQICSKSISSITYDRYGMLEWHPGMLELDQSDGLDEIDLGQVGIMGTNWSDGFQKLDLGKPNLGATNITAAYYLYCFFEKSSTREPHF